MTTWPWIVFINVPLGIAASILAMLFVHDSRYARARTRIDIIGIALLAIGLGSLQLMLEKGNEEGWFSSNYILWLAFISVTGIVAFVLYELHIPNPAVNLRVMRNRSFTAGSIYGAVVGMGLFGGVFILPVFLQQLRHYTAQQSGVLMLPGALATAAMMPVVGKLSSKVPPRYLVVFGSITFIISSVMMRNLTMDTGPWDLFWPLVLRGAGMGFLFAPLTLVTLGGLKGHEIAEGTGLFSLLRQLGGSAGIALLSTFIDHQATAHRAILSEHLTMVNPLTQVRLSELQYLFQLKGFDPITAYYAGAKVTVMSLLGQAAVLSFIDAFLLIALVFVLAAPLLLLVDNNVPGGKPDIHAAAE